MLICYVFVLLIYNVFLSINIMEKIIIGILLICCYESMVNSLSHVGMDSYPNHNFLGQAVNHYSVHITSN